MPISNRSQTAARSGSRSRVLWLVFTLVLFALFLCFFRRTTKKPATAAVRRTREGNGPMSKPARDPGCEHDGREPFATITRPKRFNMPIIGTFFGTRRIVGISGERTLEVLPWKSKCKA